MIRSCRISSRRYEEIKEIIADMYEDLGYTEIPVNVFELCQKLNIKLINYSSLSTECAAFSNQFSDDGFNLFNKETKCFQIYYNDKMLPERVTFTVMHEIGHIMLGHKEHTERKEMEANFYAKTALAPLGLIYKLKLSDPSDIAERFGISMIFAKNVARQYSNLISYPDICKKEVSSRLVALFCKYYEEAS